MKRVCVYCGSRFGDLPAYAETAKELAELLVQRDIGVVYGGGGIGLMGVVADSAMAAGGEVIGVIPSLLAEREVSQRGITKLHVVDSMHDRKLLMAKLSDAFVVLPGGIGTLDELIEVFTWNQLRIHDKPIGILNLGGYFDHLLAFFGQAVASGFLDAAQVQSLLIAEEPVAVLDALALWRPRDLSDSSLLLLRILGSTGFMTGATGPVPLAGGRSLPRHGESLNSHRPLVMTALLGLLAVLVLALSACGSSSSSVSSGSDSNDRDTARLQLQKCLRENGVDLPTPGQGGQGQRFNLDRQKIQKAMQGPCKKYQSAAFGNQTPQQRQEFQDAFVKFSACMRQNGVDVPTPGAGGAAGGGNGAGGGFRQLRNTPKFQAAMKKCQGTLPNGGRFGGGPGGGGPGGPPPAQ